MAHFQGGTVSFGEGMLVSQTFVHGWLGGGFRFLFLTCCLRYFFGNHTHFDLCICFFQLDGNKNANKPQGFQMVGETQVEPIVWWAVLKARAVMSSQDIHFPY